MCVINIPGPGEFFQTLKTEKFLSSGVFPFLEMENSLGFGVFPFKLPTCLSRPVVPHKSGTQNSIELLPIHRPQARKSPGFCSPDQRGGKRIHKSFPTFFFSREIKEDKRFFPRMSSTRKDPTKGFAGTLWKIQGNPWSLLHLTIPFFP